MTVAMGHRSIEEQLAEVLRVEVLSEVERQGLDARSLAERLDLLPTAVATVLDRSHWSLKTALVMADGLALPLRLNVTKAIDG